MALKTFLDNVASSEPTPGGGSASALAGALSASLISMVAGLSSKQRGMREIRRKSLAIQKRLFKAIDEDAKGYEEVLEAFRLPKHTERARALRSKAIQRAFQKATVIPQLVCRLSLQLLDLCIVVIREGNPNAFSDAGVAAYLADTALKGGLLNIGINLGPVKDRSFRRKLYSLTGRLEKKRTQVMRGIEKALDESKSKTALTAQERSRPSPLT